MPRCEHKIVATNRRCASNAVAGLAFCHSHCKFHAENEDDKKKTIPQPPIIPKTQSDEEISLGMPPNPTIKPVKRRKSDGDTDTSDYTMSDAPTFETVNDTSQVTNNANNITDDFWEELIGKITERLNTMGIVNKPKKAKPPSEKGILRKAKGLYYNEYKHDEIKTSAITNAARRAGLIPENEKANWLDIKIASDREFQNLPENMKKMYLDSARQMMINNLKP